MAQVLKDEVKEKIQISAVNVFTLKGYKKASIKEIAENANVSVGNVYRYFKNKDELYESVIKGVYDGINELMTVVDQQSDFMDIYADNFFEEHAYEPMKKFIDLYRREKNVFNMLLKGEKGSCYDKTIVSFIDILKNYFYKFWGASSKPQGLSYIEASALTNALVFSVVDILNSVEDNELENELMEFVPTIIIGYFIAKNSKGEKQ